MITIEEVTAVPDDFDALFDASLPYMEGGTFDWSFLGNPETDEDKREAMRAKFQEIMDTPQTKGVLWRKDGHAIHLAVGSMDAWEPGYITWILALYGPDADGSKAWLYSEDYITQCRDYFRDEWGVKGYMVNCFNDTTIMAYHLNKPNAGLYYEVTAETFAEDPNLALIKYRYL